MAKAGEKKDFLPNLNSLPSRSDFDKHYWVDYIELLCLFNREGLVTVSDFLETYKRRSSDLAEGGSIFKSKNKPASIPADNDARRVFVQECFSLVQVRQKTLKIYYPFRLSADKTYITVVKKITNLHKLYIFLLYCSSLSYFSKEMASITASFELFCLQILKNIFPRKFKVYYFGSRNKYAVPKRYTGKLYKKFEKLVQDFNEPKPSLIVKESDLANTDVGDGGVDFVGWLPNGDSLTHQFTFLGQAGCTDDWVSKQSSTSYERLKNTIHFSVNPLNFVFIPFFIRNSDGWHRRNNIGNCVLVDRLRLLHHYENKYASFQRLPSYKFLNDTLKPQNRILK